MNKLDNDTIAAIRKEIDSLPNCPLNSLRGKQGIYKVFENDTRSDKREELIKAAYFQYLPAVHKAVVKFRSIGNWHKTEKRISTEADALLFKILFLRNGF